MAEYIEREKFIAEQRHLYCENCERRKGMKNGKMKFVYAIGEVPCRACGIGDVLDSVEDAPAADVVTRDCYDRLLAENDELRKERPVVRCADCKYNKAPDKLYARCGFNYALGPQDFFCSAGERKDGDGDV